MPRPKSQFAKAVQFACTGLLMGASARASVLIFDSDANPTNGITDGAGVWNTTATNWYSGGTDVLWPNTSAYIAQFGNGSTGGTVTVSTVTTGGMQFNSSGYTFTGGTISLANASSAPVYFTLASNVNLTINSTLATSAAGLTLNGASGASLTLGGTSTYTGPTSVTSGETLTYGPGSAFNSNNTLNIGLANATAVVNFNTTGTMNWGYLEPGTNSNSGGLGLLNISAGTITVTNQTLIARSPGGAGAMNLSNSAKVTEANTLQVGGNGSGMVNMSGTSSFTVNGGIVEVGDSTDGNSGGVINLSGSATFLSAVPVYVGLIGPGTLNQLGAGSFTASQFLLGYNNCSGVINQNGGSVNQSGTSPFALGGGIGTGTGIGIYNMTGGTLTDAGNLQVGVAARGAMFISGGTVNISGSPTLANNGSGSLGVVDISGGTFNQGNTAATLTVGLQGTGVLNVRSGGTLNSSGGIMLSGNGNANGTVNLLTGGTINALSITRGSGATAVFAFNGGTLASLATSPTNFMSGLDAAYIYSGGATFNTSAASGTVAQSLLAPTGNGLSAINVTAGGSGFKAAPIVSITGGGGTGATAVATISSSGAVSGFTITDPGIGYTSSPTITLYAANSGTGVSSTSTLSANTGGGLTKIGANTLTLTGSNTYTGSTNVAAGTLVAGSANALPITTAVSINGGTLDASGFGNTISAVTLNTGALNLGAGGPLTISNAATFNGGSVMVTGIATGGLYTLLQAGSFVGTPTIGTIPASYVASVNASSATITLQHLQNQTLTMPTPSTINIITGASTTIGASLNNTAPLNSLPLRFALADNGSTAGMVSGLSPSGGTVAGAASSSISGTFTAGSPGLGGTWNISNSDPTAITPLATTGGTVNVFDHAHPALDATGDTTLTLPIKLSTISAGGTSSGSVSIYDNANTSAGYTTSETAGLGVSLANTTTPAYFTLGMLPSTAIAAGAPISIPLSLTSTQAPGTYSETFTLNTSDDLSLAGAVAQSPLTFTVTETVTGSTGVSTIIWNDASGNGIWDTSSANFNNSGSNVAYNNASNGTSGDNVIFGDNAATTAYAVSISGSLSPTSTTFNNSNGDYVISSSNAGGIIGPGAFIKLGAGNVTISTANNYSGGTFVNNGTLTLASATAFPVNSNLSIGTTTNRGTVVFSAPHIAGLAAVMSVNNLSIAGSNGAWNGTLDLTSNALIIHGSTQLASIVNQVATGYNGGNWNGSGITSSTAATDTNHLTSIGVIINDQGGMHSGSAIYNTFENAPTSDGDVLVKYTYYGDTNLDGVVDGSDYSRIDNGFVTQGTANPLSGWFNGDFNYDAVIDGSDYTLIDNTYNSQGAELSSAIATPTAEIGGSTSAVPEPASVSLIALSALGLLGRRQRIGRGK